MAKLQYRILHDNPMKRWFAGEIGEELVNDSTKYDHVLKLPGEVNVNLFGKSIKAVRVFYFYKDEVQVL